jgi:hypothetical protein
VRSDRVITAVGAPELSDGSRFGLTLQLPFKRIAALRIEAVHPNRPAVSIFQHADQSTLTTVILRCDKSVVPNAPLLVSGDVNSIQPTLRPTSYDEMQSRPRFPSISQGDASYRTSP